MQPVKSVKPDNAQVAVCPEQPVPMANPGNREYLVDPEPLGHPVSPADHRRYARK